MHRASARFSRRYFRIRNRGAGRIVNGSKQGAIDGLTVNGKRNAQKHGNDNEWEQDL